MRIGHGFDVHAFCAGDSIMLGGVSIPFTYAFKAHSDGDVLIHALCDSLLGAAGLGDIGQHFPDTDVTYKDADSALFLTRVNEMLISQSYRLTNADITIIAQSPKMAPYLPAMKQKLSNLLNCDESMLNIKATTTEYLGYIGRGEGVAVHAVALLEKVS
jgi:2-C-methyl-D-erythritol 2,4-cyclodiphosphate synthase